MDDILFGSLNQKFDPMFGLFKKDPVKKLEKEYYQLLEKARDVQRSGDIREYARLMAESEEIWKKIETLQAENGK